MKFGICNEMFESWKIEEVFACAADLGFDGVEIAPFTLADSVTEIPAATRDRIRAAAADQGIEIIGLHWLLLKPEGLYINHPEAANLGLGKIQQMPVVTDGEIGVIHGVYLSLSFDHRILDGAEAARFTNSVIQFIESPETLS